MHYVAWPDHGVPDSPQPVLGFVKEVRRLANEDSAKPVVAHCSAGIGRTGTVCVIDAVLAQLDQNLPISIKETVKQLRRFRGGMVQTQIQYEFCYTAIREEILSRLSAAEASAASPASARND